MLVRNKERMKEVKSILVSQPEPSNPNSPYHKLAEKYNLKIDFRKFIEIDPLDIKEFRKQKVNIADHTAVIFTSRNAIDHFFRLAQESKIEIPADMKYFCISETTANYLQKYIIIRKRRIFTGERTASDLLRIIKKHKDEKFIFPCSNIRTDDIPNFLNQNNYDWSEATIYRTVVADLSDLDNVTYDIIAFFSPSGIESLLQNFPEFKQNNTRIAAFGPTTSKAVKDAGLVLDIQAPLPNAPSMTGALEVYVKETNNL
ncbi:MAG: uroporphyrinogen-III synthase [Ekhidna sp.]|nr:uroporphyrinogen-III synthase [Ekhidna sp.]MBC6409223.1 uroporphyrinogen-III synthase [Ekhidna sp.]MBC6424990.1 uroporphyrinogen-III synthase [Ekhidna sp.]